MERLTHTKKSELGYIQCAKQYTCDHEIDCNECEQWVLIAEKLKAYEDTGLTPEEVMEYKKFEDELILRHDITFNKALERIEKYPKVLELLKLAAGDINGIFGADTCEFCKNSNYCNDHDQSYCQGINFKWQYADRLKELGVEI